MDSKIIEHATQAFNDSSNNINHTNRLISQYAIIGNGAGFISTLGFVSNILVARNRIDFLTYIILLIFAGGMVFGFLALIHNREYDRDKAKVYADFVVTSDKEGTSTALDKIKKIFWSLNLSLGLFGLGLAVALFQISKATDFPWN